MNRLAVEIVVLVLLAAGAGLWFHSYTVQQREIGAAAVKQADKDATDKQRRKDEGVLAAARRDHENEMAQTALGYAAALAGIKPRIVRIPAAPGPVQPPAAVEDQGRPAANGPASCELSADQKFSVLVLAHRVDELNAAARAVNEALQ